MNREYLKENVHNYKNIIYAGSWSDIFSKGHFDDVESVVDQSAKAGGNVFIMAAPYRYQKSPLQDFYRSIYLDLLFDINAIGGKDALMNEANIRLKELSDKYASVYFIGGAMLYAEQGTFNVGGVTVPYNLDGGHISMLGSKYSAKHFMSQSKYDITMSYFDLDENK